jgi:hypothetical protein
MSDLLAFSVHVRFLHQDFPSSSSILDSDFPGLYGYRWLKVYVAERVFINATVAPIITYPIESHPADDITFVLLAAAKGRKVRRDCMQEEREENSK